MAINKKITLVYTALITSLAILGFLTYSFIMIWDRNTLEHTIESSIMKDLYKIYDYSYANQGYTIKEVNPKKTGALANIEKLLKGTGNQKDSLSHWFLTRPYLGGYGLATERKMQRYSVPETGQITPFCIMSIKKNDKLCYTIREIRAIGIGYKYATSESIFLQEEEAPNIVYNKAFNDIIHGTGIRNISFNDYTHIRNSRNNISRLLPRIHDFNWGLRNDSQIKSLFHTINFKPLHGADGFPSSSGGDTRIEYNRYEVYIQFREDHISITEYNQNTLVKIVLIVFSIILIVSVTIMHFIIMPKIVAINTLKDK